MTFLAAVPEPAWLLWSPMLAAGLLSLAALASGARFYRWWDRTRGERP